MKPNAVAALMAVTTALAGCGDAGSVDIERFAEAWRRAAGQDHPEGLFDLLDARSRGDIERQLEQLRGLGETARGQVRLQLGLPEDETLADLPASRYFALLWRKAVGEAELTMQVRSTGPAAGVLTVSAGDGRSHGFDLFVEGGRWVWRMPGEEKAGNPESGR